MTYEDKYINLEDIQKRFSGNASIPRSLEYVLTHDPRFEEIRTTLFSKLKECKYVELYINGSDRDKDYNLVISACGQALCDHANADLE